jgi:hypothetical protein
MKEQLAHTAYKAGSDLIDKPTPGPRDYLIQPDASAADGSSEKDGIPRYRFHTDGSFIDAAELSKGMNAHAKECNSNEPSVWKRYLGIPSFSELPSAAEASGWIK